MYGYKNIFTKLFKIEKRIRAQKTRQRRRKMPTADAFAVLGIKKTKKKISTFICLNMLRRFGGI